MVVPRFKKVGDSTNSALQDIGAMYQKYFSTMKRAVRIRRGVSRDPGSLH
jgi:hypothetical protein